MRLEDLERGQFFIAEGGIYMVMGFDTFRGDGTNINDCMYYLLKFDPEDFSFVPTTVKVEFFAETIPLVFNERDIAKKCWASIDKTFKRYEGEKEKK